MKFKFYSALLSIITIFLLFSCTKEKKEAISDDISLQINKVETSLKAGEMKLEGENDLSASKFETRAPESYIKKIREALTNSYSKKSAALSSTSTYLVGVLSNGSCGSNRKLRVFMDCEDATPHYSSVTGWTGECNVDNSQNVNLYFCIVDGTNFQRSNTQAYATLRLDASLPDKVSSFTRYIDNEDNNNGNNISIDGTWQPKPTTMGACVFSDNDKLAFNYYTVSTDFHSFPDLLISYGVIGTFGSVRGSIYLDDEDNNNASWTSQRLYIDANNAYDSAIEYNVPSGIISDLVGVEGYYTNTRLYFSKVY